MLSSSTEGDVTFAVYDKKEQIQKYCKLPKVYSACRGEIFRLYIKHLLDSSGAVIAATAVSRKLGLIGVAFITLHSHHAFLNLLCSSRRARKGIGKHLLNIVEDVAVQNGKSKMELHAMNEDLVNNFYSVNGYKPCKVRSMSTRSCGAKGPCSRKFKLLTDKQKKRLEAYSADGEWEGFYMTKLLTKNC